MPPYVFSLSPANDLPLCKEASRGFGLRKLAPNWKNRTRQLSSSKGDSCAKGHPMVNQSEFGPSGGSSHGAKRETTTLHCVKALSALSLSGQALWQL